MFDIGLSPLAFEGRFPLFAIRHKRKAQKLAATQSLLLGNLVDALKQIVR